MEVAIGVTETTTAWSDKVTTAEMRSEIQGQPSYRLTSVPAL